jgi:hypothetical protein
MVNGGQFVRPRLVADLAGQPVEAVPPEQVLDGASRPSCAT